MSTRLLKKHWKRWITPMLGIFFLLTFGNNAPLFGQSNNTDCRSIQFEIIDNQLTISNLDLISGGVKIFDDQYQEQFVCNFDCGATASVANLDLDKEVHAIFDFHDAQNRFVGTIRKDFIPSNELPSIKVFKGDLTLSSQAEVDAYCGYDVVEGELYIGASDGIDSDIVDVSNLQQLQLVGTRFSIIRTKLENLSDLIHIRGFSTFSLQRNPLIEEVGGFNEIEATGLIFIFSNAKLHRINGFKQLKTLDRLEIRDSPAFTTFNEFNALTAISTLRFEYNPNLKSIEGLTALQSFTGSFTVRENPLLEKVIFNQPITDEVRNIDFIDNPKLTEISGYTPTDFRQLVITDNLSLSDCCVFEQLLKNINSSPPFSYAWNIENNGTNCNSVNEILNSCEEVILPCDDQINIVTENNQLIISGITAPNAIVKVYDPNYNLIFECNANCEETILLENLTAGEFYHTDVQLFDEDFEAICRDESDILIASDGSLCPPQVCQGTIVFSSPLR